MERLDAVEPDITLNRKFWAMDDAERNAMAGVFEDPEVTQMILALDHKDADRTVRLVDAAYWMKGCSSLGLLRFAAIVGLKNATGRSDYALVDFKEAVDPVAPASPGAIMPSDNGARVAAASSALSPHLGERMIPVRMLGRSFFLRELAPQDMKLEVDQFSEGQAARAAHYLAFVVGKAHARQMDREARRRWMILLESDRRGMIDAPSWLWESVVALAGRHESGYLDHCRRYALAA